jgi:NADPH:quinone reductase-like Zn-dependent oxidoreductase
MRALEVDAPWGLDQFKFVERPDPKPGPGEVLVRMRTASLNYRDLMMVSGYYPGVRGPITPLSDGCGVVEAVGEGVTRVAPGDRVSSLFFQSWIGGRVTAQRISRPLGSPVPGVARELAVYSAEGVSKVPDFLTDEEVATLPCAGLTAWRALFDDGDLDPGDMVVLQGTGGVSIFGLQFAHMAGMRTLITSSSDEKLERARGLGADHLVNYRTTPEWAGAVRTATHGVGADFIMEVGGPGTMPQSLRAIATGGHIAVVGMVAAGGEGVNPTSLIATGAKLQGLMVGSRDSFEAMCRAIDKNRIRPVVDKVFPWTEARAAFEAMRDGAHFGKIVLKF